MSDSCERTRKWRKSPQGQAYSYNYNRSDANKECQKRYLSTKKGKENRYKQCRKNYKNFPLKNKARDAVKYAVKKGILPNIKSLKCLCCGKNATIYHHYKGYEKQYHLVIEPVCYMCHYKIHHFNDQ